MPHLVELAISLRQLFHAALACPVQASPKGRLANFDTAADPMFCRKTPSAAQVPLTFYLIMVVLEG